MADRKKINALWGHHMEGRCGHFKATTEDCYCSPPSPRHKIEACYDCNSHSGCDGHLNDIPAYDEDPAVILGAIKNLLKDEGDENQDYGVAITKIEDTYCISNLHTDPPRCLKIHIEDESLELAAMRAQLKKKGVEA